jgi:hypothetical protein
MSDTSTPNEPLEMKCPCCSTKLVLHEERPKKAAVSWDQALSAGEAKQVAAEAMFKEGMDRENRADDILEKKFKEALKRADKNDDPPPRIFDLD